MGGSSDAGDKATQEREKRTRKADRERCGLCGSSPQPTAHLSRSAHCSRPREARRPAARSCRRYPAL